MNFDNKKTILCYGDSNTYGYEPLTGTRYPKEKRWVNILQKKLGPDYEIVSEGLNGRTTAYDRLDCGWKNGLPYLAPCMESNKPLDYIIFMLGTNDCNYDLELSAEDIALGMEKLVLHVEKVIPEMQDFLPKIVIVAPAAILPDYKNSPFADQLNDDSIKKSHEIVPLYKEIARKHNCLFLDVSNSAEVSTFDSEHLTAKGHEHLAEKLAELILNNE